MPTKNPLIPIAGFLAAAGAGALLVKGVIRARTVAENVKILTSVDTGSVWTTE